MTPDKVEAALGVLRRYGELCIGEGWTLEKGRVDEALSVLTEALAEKDKLLDMIRRQRDVFFAEQSRLAKELSEMERDAARWLPIDSVPDSSQVVLFCDARGNRWTQCANAWDIPECGLPASFWKPLPEPPHDRHDYDGMDKAIREACQPDPEWVDAAMQGEPHD